MMSNVAIGMDLGTSTSEVAFFRNGKPEVIRDSDTKSPIIPSLVAINKKGQLLVGESARDWVDLPGYGAREVKRKMGKGEMITLGDKEYHPEELSAVILDKLKRNAEVMLGEKITDIVLSVPANFNDAAKQATLHAAEIAGLNVIQLINEPTAAALAFGIENIDLEAQIVVFDFGGGTLDVSTLEMMEGVLEVKSSYGDTQLGGKDFDETMINLILRKFYKEHGEIQISDKSRDKLKAVAEKAKIILSSHHNCEVNLDNFVQIDGELVDLVLDVSRSEFENELEPLLIRARACLSKAMKEGKFKPSAIDRVVMVGGTTYIPCVRSFVEEFFGKSLIMEIDPDFAVALGAATVAGIKKGHVDARNSLIFSEVCPMGIGTNLMSNIGDKEIVTYVSLIKPNDRIPYVKSHNFSLRYVDQTEVEFNIFQTHLPDDLFPLEMGLNKGLIDEIGLSGEINNIPPSKTDEPHPFRINLSYDGNGIVNISAEIPGYNCKTIVTFEHSKYRLSHEDLEEARMKFKELLESSNENFDDEVDVQPRVKIPPTWIEHPRAKQFQPIINRSEKLMIDYPQHKDQLTEHVNNLKLALHNGDDKGISKAGDALTDLLFEIQS
jgi:molecular chaperone DnaK